MTNEAERAKFEKELQEEWIAQDKILAWENWLLEKLWQTRTPVMTNEAEERAAYLLREAMACAVRMAFARHNLEPDPDAATEEEIAYDAAGACFGEECCDDKPIAEVTELIALAARAASPVSAPTSFVKCRELDMPHRRIPECCEPIIEVAPVVCTRPLPHICEVNGPCNGLPKEVADDNDALKSEARRVAPVSAELVTCLNEEHMRFSVDSWWAQPHPKQRNCIEPHGIELAAPSVAEDSATQSKKEVMPSAARNSMSMREVPFNPLCDVEGAAHPQEHAEDWMRKAAEKIHRWRDPSISDEVYEAMIRATESIIRKHYAASQLSTEKK